MKLHGIYHATDKGFGFFTPEGETGRSADLFVPPKAGKDAWDGDEVAVTTRPDPRTPGRVLAQVSAVLRRNTKTVVGTLTRYRTREVWLTPSDSRLNVKIKILGKTARLRSGDLAAVTLQSYGTPTTPPFGVLKEVFGPHAALPAVVESILYENGIRRDFPAAAWQQAAALPQAVTEGDLAGRLDLRDTLAITIDGASSKDFDDAVSLTREGDGWKLGVHIADVSHYVPYGSPLDLEAYDRGTSVYFADQVVPMLPEALSNGICSLNPQVDRLALSCLMTLDAAGKVVEHTIAKTVIHSHERMTYGDCNLLLANADAALAEKYAHILPMLRDMAALSKTLEGLRRSRGALDLESKECYVVCDEHGLPVEIRLRETGPSEKLIESFMLLANETVAQHLCQENLPGVYRVHENPSEEKLDLLKRQLAPMGYNLRQGDNGSLQKVLDAAAGTPQAPAIHMMVLRSMMKARYDPKNLGHFGLAAPYYCHFTSPIRRYPDLMVHRVLTAMLDKAPMKVLTSAADPGAKHSSDREVAAMTAERDIEKRYMAQFMTAHVGETFHGLVSGVTRFGLFVTLENGVEGLLPTSALPAGGYEYDEVRLTLTCPAAAFSFGMPLEVTCVGADVASGEISLALPGQELPIPRPAQPAKPPRPKDRPHGRPHVRRKGKRR